MPRGSTASTGARGAIFHLSVVGVLRVPHVVGGVGPRLPTAVVVARLPAGKYSIDFLYDGTRLIRQMNTCTTKFSTSSSTSAVY